MIRQADTPVIGRVVATEQLPASPHQFFFWSATESEVGIGAIVRVDGTGDRTVFGVVIDAKAYSDLAEPMHDVIAAHGDPAATNGMTQRREIRLWTAAVLRQMPEEPLQPVPLSVVTLATPDDVKFALRMESYTDGDSPTGVPIGVYVSGGLRAPVYVDADFLLGPESAHLNITGVSGLATKTSAVEFALRCLFDHFPTAKGRVAALCFNVKGADLCFLDQAAALGPSDLEMYELLDVKPQSFDTVRYFAPFKSDGVNLNTLRSHQDLVSQVEPLVWGLREVLDYHEVLLNRDDLDAKAAAFIDFLRDRVVEKDFRDDWGGQHRITTFAELDRLFKAIFDGLEAQGRSDSWRTHHIATIRKVRNRLINISLRCKGLVTDDGVSNDLPFGEFVDRGVYVIDVAGMDQLAQDLVFTRVVSQLRERLERRDLGVEHIVVFVDELNKYAPSDGPETYVRKMLLDIAERGRYLGLVLFSAQQFRSQVHRRIVGNAGTSAFGRMDMDELSTPGYQVLSPATKIKLATLPKGEIMIRHPHFTQPVFLRFPRPPVLTGPEGLAKFPPAAEVSLEDAVVQQLRALDPAIERHAVQDAVVGRTEEVVRRALLATRRSAPTNVLRYFKAALGARVQREVIDDSQSSVAPLQSVQDPYAP